MNIENKIFEKSILIVNRKPLVKAFLTEYIFEWFRFIYKLTAKSVELLILSSFYLLIIIKLIQK